MLVTSDTHIRDYTWMMITYLAHVPCTHPSVCCPTPSATHPGGMRIDAVGGWRAYNESSAFDGVPELAFGSITTKGSLSLHALMLSASPKCPSLQMLPIARLSRGPLNG